MVPEGMGLRGLGKKEEEIKLQNSPRDIKYSIENIVNNIINTYVAR